MGERRTVAAGSCGLREETMNRAATLDCSALDNGLRSKPAYPQWMGQCLLVLRG